MLSQGGPSTPVQATSWPEALLEARRAKDRSFAASPDSPLPPAARAGFRGLAYYPPDARYRLEAALLRDRLPRPVALRRSAGDEAVYLRVGVFELPLPEGMVRLAAYRGEGDRGSELFVPFRDATSGVETYHAGRYLEAREVAADRYLVDFNEAYHPFCAYDASAYTCPLPPRENWLRVHVRAGERLVA